ncbi:MAG: sigma-70 family RNA polymerase sigma factor [Verrucomicrobiales bacterium]|nr:sigma-70 family RNA polymerase sigma factor [Verrucomicrobiales bacterium]
MRDEPAEEARPGMAFATTHWSVVLAVGRPGEGHDREASEAALALLCQTYWFPLYAHIRRRGNDPEASRDLTQGLFADLLGRDGIARARPDAGRFRSFLLKSADHYLHRMHRDLQALKRGGGREVVSFDAMEAEERLALEPHGEGGPERDFDRRCAIALLERARTRLRAEFMSTGKVELFDLLRPHLYGDLEAVPYAEIGKRTNLTVVAIKQTACRLRRRFGELLRAEVAQTLARPGDVDEELRHLLAALG